MKLKKLGLPYMGGKRQLSEKLVNFMLNENPNCKYVYDLFGGGGAMSFEFSQHERIKQVFYNEIDESIVNLLQKIQSDGITHEFYKWISREEFFELKQGNGWRSGFAKTCWSFGNIGKSYIFAKSIEEKKRILHDIIVYKSFDARCHFTDITGIIINDSLLSSESINERRLSVMKYIKSIKRINLQQLEQLERLERLEQLKTKVNFSLSNKSYACVEITTPIDETIIYLDPPYFNTAKYNNNICHDALHDYIEKSPYKIYLSSYESPLKCVYGIEHRGTLSSTNNNKKVVEKLFCNRD
jgi:site-specific DNA-adenine methylase